MSEQNNSLTTEQIIGQVIREMSENERKQKITRFEHLNHFAQKNAILFTGSSLMEHFPIEELRIAAGIEPVIYNRGVGGFTTDDFLTNIHTVLLDLEPSKVFINIGTNDISLRFGGEDGWLPHLIQNYDTILSQLQTALPDCQVYLMAYYPSNQQAIANSPWGREAFGLRTRENMRKANQEVKNLAEKHQYHFIDVNEGLADSNGELKAEYTTDGVHMIPDAYVQILHNMNPYL